MNALNVGFSRYSGRKAKYDLGPIGVDSYAKPFDLIDEMSSIDAFARKLGYTPEQMQNFQQVKDEVLKELETLETLLDVLEFVDFLPDVPVVYCQVQREQARLNLEITDQFCDT